MRLGAGDAGDRRVAVRLDGIEQLLGEKPLDRVSGSRTDEKYGAAGLTCRLIGHFFDPGCDGEGATCFRPAG